MTTESLSVTIEGELLTVEIGTVAAPAGGGGSAAWGDITGTLSAQTDLQTALNLKSPLASPTFTGTPAAPTAAGATSTTQIATTAFVAGEITTHAGAIDPHGDRAYADGLAGNYATAGHNHSDVYQPLAIVLTNTTAAFTTAQETKLSGIETAADVTDAGNVGTAIDGATAKTTPVDADTVALIDSAAGNVLKKLSWANIRATAKTYFDTLYQTASATLTTWAGITPGIGIATALAANVDSAGAPVVNGGALGTPSSGSLANCTGYPAAGTTLQVQYNNAGAFGGMNLWRESADISAFRNGTTAQTVHAYKTTDAGNVNYERLAFVPGAATGWMQIAAQSGGTGAANYGIALSPKGTGAVSAQVPDSGTGGGIARGSNSVDWQTSRSSSAMVAAGLASVVAGGVNNISSNTYSVVSGGGDNNANGIVSWIPGGYQAITRSLYGAYAYSAGRRSANGDAQVIGQPVRRTTTDATPVSLATDGTPAVTTVMVLPANSTLMATAIVVARDSSGNSAGWIAQALFKRDGSSNTSRLGSATVTPIGTPDAAINTATIDLVANDTLESAQIQVTGVAATTIYWVGELKCVQVL